MKRCRVLAVLQFVLLLGACAHAPSDSGGSTPRVALQTDRARYAPGDTVFVTLRNSGDVDAGYNLCMHTLQMHTARGWTDVQSWPPARTMCILPITILQPGGALLVNIVLPDSASSGTYRIHYPGAPSEVPMTNAFIVQPR